MLLPDSLPIQAARLALLMLRAAAGHPGDSPAGYVLLPSNTVLAADRAVIALSGLPKPQICTARWDLGNVVVSCEPVTSQQTITSMRSWADEAAQRVVEVIRWLNGPDSSSDPALLFQAAGEQFLTSLGAYALCEASYTVLGHGSALRPRDSSARALGAAAIIALSSSEGATVTIKVEP